MANFAHDGASVGEPCQIENKFSFKNVKSEIKISLC